MPKLSKYMVERQMSPEEDTERVARNRVWRKALRKGRVRKGDDEYVLDTGESAVLSNTQIADAKYNRAWRKRNLKTYD